MPWVGTAARSSGQAGRKVQIKMGDHAGSLGYATNSNTIPRCSVAFWVARMMFISTFVAVPGEICNPVSEYSGAADATSLDDDQYVVIKQDHLRRTKIFWSHAMITSAV